jgi:hypothetical protein
VPSLPPPVWAELHYSGAFNSITDDVLVQDAVSASRGRGSERESAGPSSGSMTLLNTGAKFSRRNPNSALFGEVGLNTPIRYGYDGLGSVWAEATGDPASYLSTASSSAYDITADLDVRVEIAAQTWARADGDFQHVANRYDTTTNNRSWTIVLSPGGLPQLYWSTDGATGIVTTGSAYVPAHGGNRIALRATLDVSNDDGVYEVRFYTALSVDSEEWTLLGDPVVGGTSTSVYNPAIPIEFGARSTIAAPGLEGRLYRLQLRDGIGGTVLLDVDTSLADPGDTSFQDANSVTWTANSITFTRRHIRFHGEVPDWTPLRDKSGAFRTVSISPAGISRRLSAGEKVLRSPLFREMSSPARENIVGYWPCEDSQNALSVASGLPNRPPGVIEGNGVSLAADSDTWRASDPLPTFATGRLSFPVPSYTDTGEAALRFLLAPPAGGVAAEAHLLRLQTTGTARQWDLWLEPAGSLRVAAYDADGASLDDSTISFAVNGATVAVTFEISVSASTITRRLLVTTYLPGYTVDDPIPVSSSSNTFTGTAVGRITSASLGSADADLGGTVMGHLAIANALAGYANTGHATIGWNGETVRSRLIRLAAEEAVPLSVAMDGTSQPRMGVQQSGAFLELLRQAEKADQGILFERRDGAELAYRGAATLLSQEPVLTLDFEGGLFDDIRPKDDDRAAFNVMTARRAGGSEYTYELTEGTNSVQDPPDGIGRYGTSVELSLSTDDALPGQAAWRVHVATVDEMRYPAITLNLANERTFALFDDIMRVDVGDKIRLTNLPPDYSVDDVDLLVWGPSEAPGPDAWPVTFICVPAEPWNVAWVGSATTATSAKEFQWADGDYAQLAGALNTTDTTVQLLTTSGPVWWGGVADTPYDWRISGEIVTVAAPGSLVNSNPFFDASTTGWTAESSTVTRSTTYVHPHPRALASARIVPDGVAASGGMACALSAVDSITPGAQYTISMWVYSPGGWSDLRPSVHWYTNGGTFISTAGSAQPAVAAGVWTYLEETVTAPSTAGRAKTRARHGGTPATSNDYYVWAVRTTRPTASWLYDAFGRTTSNGWGTSDSGLTWNTVGGGAAADYAVGSGYGSQTLTSTGVSRRTAVTAIHADFDIYCDITTSALATGTESLYGGVTARMLDASNMYLARLQFTTSNTIILSLRKVIADTQTELGAHTLTGVTHVAGTYIRVRFQGQGSTLRAKAWLATAVEPGVWHIEASDSAITAANQIGTRSISGSGNTNVNPAVRYENFDVINPQLFTGIRSVNGVVKAPAAASPVRLAHPAIVSL